MFTFSPKIGIAIAVSPKSPANPLRPECVVNPCGKLPIVCGKIELLWGNSGELVGKISPKDKNCKVIKEEYSLSVVGG